MTTTKIVRRVPVAVPGTVHVPGGTFLMGSELVGAELIGADACASSGRDRSAG